MMGLFRKRDSAAGAGGGGDTVVAVGELSQLQLVKLKFGRHRLAVFFLRLLIIIYFVAAFCEFFAPYTREYSNLDYKFAPPQLPVFNFEHGWHAPAMKMHLDPITYEKVYTNIPGEAVPLSFFVKGKPYRMLGLFEWDRHFFGVDHRALERRGGDPEWAVFYFLGSDQYGQDLFSRIIYGSRISLSIGLLAIMFTTIIGVVLGGISGYKGGRADELIQRLIEVVRSFPQIPLWIALVAILPAEWPLLVTYLGITVVLSFLGWTGLARQVRGKILSLREEDYAVAARLMGASQRRVLFRHLVPGFVSHIIVVITITIPSMILGETALSFLGLGLREPIVSWGVMLQDAMHLQTLENYPWILAPVLAIMMTVLAFNFVGDGLRDAADPYSRVS